VSRLAIAVLLIACSHPAKSSVPPEGKPTDGKLQVGPPLVTPGERMQYRVSLRNIELAAFSINVGELTNLDGKQTVTVQGHAKLVGLATLIGGNIDDKFTSWLDLETGRSLRFQVDEYASKSKDMEHTVVDLGRREGDTVPITFRLNDEPEKPEPQKVATPVIWDYNSFLIAMRSWEGPPGSKEAMEVFRSRNLWHVTVTIRGRERLTTALGELPALRFDAETYRVKRDGTKDTEADERKFSLWISDDAGRVPLQINARTDYGDVKMQIVDYQPGNGDPIRP
jgi:hypothetical protein